jgi:hypothetical protein
LFYLNLPLKLSHARHGHPLGIGCSAERTHTVLDVVQQKVFNKGHLLIGEIGRGSVQQSSISASIFACPFLYSFLLGKQKKGRSVAQAKKVEA